MQDRRKLEYLLKRVEINQHKEIYFIIDPDGVNGFSKKACQCLKTGDSMYAVLDEEDRKPLDAQFIYKFAQIFSRINSICVSNKTAPLFPNPGDVKQCEEIREDLIKWTPENILNDFYGVSDFREYIPPVYNGRKPMITLPKWVIQALL